MKRFWITAMHILTSGALIGLVLTQLFWVKNAVELKDEQFKHRVELGLKSIVNHLVAWDKSNGPGKETSCGLLCGLHDSSLVDSFSPVRLDSLVQDEFSHLKVNDDYIYGIFNRRNHQLIFSSSSGHNKELVNTPLFISLTCVYKYESYVLGVYFPEQESLILRSMSTWLVFSIAFIIIVLVGFTLTIFILTKQKKLSEMKSDFVNNMTHEFKTPIATISLAGEMLTIPAVSSSSEKTQRYGSIIVNEINRLKTQVEQVLQIAVLDKGEYRLKKKEVDLHRILETVLKSFGMIVKKRNGKIVMNLEAENSVVFADKDHITNVLYNILDNAEKYSPEEPHITVSTRNTKQGILISVEDNGLGISAEAQRHIFKKLYRVPTGNIHNVKGFGLGLFYAKTMVEAHQGTIHLHSELRKGSTFEIYLPFGEAGPQTEEDEG